MSSILKISEAGAIALHAAVYLAAQPAAVCRAATIAGALRVSEAHLVKVLQRLAHAGLVSAVRGPAGGYRLAGDPARLVLLQVYEAIEGALPSAACLFRERLCDGRHCILGSLTGQLNAQTLDYLSHTSLSSLAGKSHINRKAPGAPVPPSNKRKDPAGLIRAVH